MVNFIIDFYGNPNESSNDIYKNLIKILNSNKLNIENLIGYGADYASVNYGANHSELCTKFNFSIKCNYFHDFVKDNIELLNAKKSDKKYKFRHNK